jgi:hypothetical protein
MGRHFAIGACLGLMLAFGPMPGGVALGQPAGNGLSPFVPEAAPEEVAPMPDTGLDFGNGPRDWADEKPVAYSSTDYYGTTFGGGCLAGPPGRTWLRADYLVWWAKGTRIPALVTTTSRAAVQLPPQTQADADAFAASATLGDGFTTVLFGNDRVNEGARQGYRFSLGHWFSDCRLRGIQADYFDIGGRSTNFDAPFAECTPPILARPFFDITPPNQTPVPARELVKYPNLVTGRVTVNVRDYFQSAGAALRLNVACCESPCSQTIGWSPARALTAASSCDGCLAGTPCGIRCFRLDMTLGYRYYQLGDVVAIREQLVTTGGILPLGTTFDVQDTFRATNDYHGAELGLVFQWYRCRWSIDLLAKMALGNNHQTVLIDGRTEIVVPGFDPVVHENSGFLALEGTNVGVYSRDSFVVIPQFGIEVGYQLTCRLRAFMGYNFLYWAHVTRAGDTIDLVVNQEFVPPPLTPTGPRRPAFNNADHPWAQTDYWAQGMNFGLELRY